MNITICNFKGGVGKSLIAHQLITSFDFSGVEIDPYGNLADRLQREYQKLIYLKKILDNLKILFLTLVDLMM